MSLNHILRGLAASVFVFVATAATAQHYHNPNAPDERLNASGEATFEVSPDRAVLLVAVSGSGEEPQDAMVKFRDNRRRAVEALEAVPVDGLTVEPQGVGLSYMYDQQELNQMRNGQADAVTPTPQIIVSESLRVVLPDLASFEDEEALVAAMQQVITAVRDQGLGLGQNPTAEMASYNYGYNAQPQALFTFESTDTDERVAAAREGAVEDARSNAEETAALIGATLGPIVSFSENVTVPAENRTDMYGNRRGYNHMGQPTPPAAGDAITSTLLGPATVQVTVSLRFAITPGSAGDGQGEPAEQTQKRLEEPVDPQEAELPEVEIRGGEAPRVDVEGPSVQVESRAVEAVE